MCVEDTFCTAHSSLIVQGSVFKLYSFYLVHSETTEEEQGADAGHQGESVVDEFEEEETSIAVHEWEVVAENTDMAADLSASTSW